MIIALGHYSRTGKDTFVNECIHEIRRIDPTIPCHKLSFAWKLKDICHQLFQGFGLEPPEFYESEVGAAQRDIPLGVIDLTPVEIWIEVGNKLREVYPEVWRDYVMHNRQPGITFIPDCRFFNEVEAVREDSHENVLIKMVRPGRQPRDSRSDRELLAYDGWDFVLGGDNVDAVIQSAREFAAWLAGRRSRPQRDLKRETWLLEEERQVLEESCEITTA